MATPQTVNLLRSIWPSEVEPWLKADLERVKMALIKANAWEEVRALQGRAHALVAMLNLPEHLAAQMGRGTGMANWIDKAIKKPGALHEDLGVPQGQKIPVKKIQAATKLPGIIGRRARLAMTLGKMPKP